MEEQHLFPAKPTERFSLRDWAAETVGILVCEVIFLISQGRRNFRVMAVPSAKATCRVQWSKSFLGGMPAEAGRLCWVCPQGNSGVGHALLERTASIRLSRLGEYKVNGTRQHLYFLRNFLMFPAPPSHVLRFVNKSLSHIPQVVFKLVLLSCVLDLSYSLCWLLCSFLPQLAFPELSLLIF